MRSARHYLELMLYKAYAELRAEATRAYLGFIWWFAEPLLYMAVFYLIFQTGLRRGGTDFVPFLLCGLVPWKWFASTVLSGAGVVGRNAAIIHQVYLPKLLLPGVVVITNSLKFAVVMIILLAFIAVRKDGAVTPAWAALPLLLGVQLMLITGLTVLVSAFIPIAQDLRLLLENFMMMLFFLSGIFFDINQVPGTLGQALLLNPVAVLIDGYRDVLLAGSWPDTPRLGGVFIAALLLFAAGAAVMVRLDRDYPRMVVK